MLGLEPAVNTGLSSDCCHHLTSQAQSGENTRDLLETSESWQVGKELANKKHDRQSPIMTRAFPPFLNRLEKGKLGKV